MKKRSMWLFVVILASAILVGVGGCGPGTYISGSPDERDWKKSAVRILKIGPDSMKSFGTGIVIQGAKRSYIMTAQHVVENATKLWIWVENDTGHFPHPARVVGEDEWEDVAFLVPDTDDRTFTHALVPIPFGNSDLLRDAERRTISVRSIGYSENIWTRAEGHVLNGNVPGYKVNLPCPSVILNTAVANAGGSGGVLLNEQGEIVGLNVRVAASETFGWYHAVSVSIPSNDIVATLMRVERGETIEHAMIKIDYYDTEDIIGMEYVKLNIPLPTHHGVIVTDVEDSSTAQEADMRPGDIIVKFNGRSVSDANELYRMIRTELAPSRPAYLQILRGNDLLYKVIMPQTYKKSGE